MVDIIELPPEEAPRTITARYAIQTLGEHYTAFLAANNLSGWSAPDDYILRPDRLADVLLGISLSTGMYLGHLKRQTKKLKKITEASGSKLKQGALLNILARALGYSSYFWALKCRSPEDFIENLWPLGASMSLQTLEGDVTTIVGDPLANQRLLRNYKANKIRDAEPSVKGVKKDRMREQARSRLLPRD